MSEILLPTRDVLERAARLIRAGRLVGMPTETVYGLAGNAFDERALTRIFSVKERPVFDPLIVHVPRYPFSGVISEERLDGEARRVVALLAAAFWPGPLTLVLPKDPRVPDLATSGLDTVGVRVPAHPVARALLEASGVPLAAPSANRFGRISPTRAQHVASELGDRIPLILDGGRSPVGVESTIVAVGAGGGLVLLRPGGIPREALVQVSGAEVRVVPGAGETEPGVVTPMAPGMLESHYAPRKTLVLLPAPLDGLPDEVLGRILAGAGGGGGAEPPGEGPALLLQFGGPDALERAAARVGAREVRSLSEGDDPGEAARHLFEVLREMDASDQSTWILAEPAHGDTGLRHAINDRLGRASASRAGERRESGSG
ncbi:MAG: threonylcarbamoyl-AMP synthase [Gemmatimonadales bacterium]|nr:MAG: threonylcarbamoyl-AMP synthase [Gemmatimonadales bacterium]